MSTRSVIAFAFEGNKDEWTRGRYVHSDGYPLGVGATLLDIVQRDGVETAERILTVDHGYWSMLDSDIDADNLPELYDFMKDDPRWDWVTGYGRSSADEEDQEIFRSDGDGWPGAEWCYVVTPRHLHVFKAQWNTGDRELVRSIPLDVDRDSIDWIALEESATEEFA